MGDVECSHHIIVFVDEVVAVKLSMLLDEIRREEVKWEITM